jgi:hypothetical protein
MGGVRLDQGALVVLVAYGRDGYAIFSACYPVEHKPAVFVRYGRFGDGGIFLLE